MRADILNLNGEKVRSIELPKQFNEEYRPDLIKRAILALRSVRRQPYGAYERAGKDYSAKLSRRRKDYKGGYGKGISRVPRKTLWHRGTQFGWVGALAPGTVGGRRAHPPKAEKSWAKKINKKERRRAIRSAIAASTIGSLVGIKNIPLILDSKIESINKTKELIKVFSNLGLEEHLERASKKTIRAGRGKARGRRYKLKKGPLIVVGDKCNLLKVTNISGVDISPVNFLSAEILAPGFIPRVILWSEKAIEKLKNDNLFTDIKKEVKIKKELEEEKTIKRIKKK
ncbi:MAG: 50S ribosomal protein L4 [Nanoarchaeota archaeon]